MGQTLADLERGSSWPGRARWRRPRYEKAKLKSWAGGRPWPRQVPSSASTLPAVLASASWRRAPSGQRAGYACRLTRRHATSPIRACHAATRRVTLTAAPGMVACD